MPPAPRVRGTNVIPRYDRRIATQADWEELLTQLDFAPASQLDRVSIEDSAARVSFPLRPPRVTGLPLPPPGAHPVDWNLSQATQIVLASEERAFKRHEAGRCERCARIGNTNCFFLPKSGYTECLLCWADGKVCSHGQPVRTPRQARRDAVNKLVRMAQYKDPGKAEQALKEFEAAEEERDPSDVGLWFRTKKPEVPAPTRRTTY